MFKFQFAVLLLVVLSSCSAIHLDEGIPSRNPEYGLSPEHPLALYSNFREAATEKTEEYLKGLRTAGGEKLRIVGRSKVPNPNYKAPKLVLYNWITGEQINQGNGSFLVRYELQSESGKDSLLLYVNHFVREEPLKPVSLVTADDHPTFL